MAEVFFFDQLVVLTRKKRHRKLPDELPRSLRFANLPPTLAAFLTSQERQKQRGGGGEYDDFGELFGDDDPDGRPNLPNLNTDAQLFRRLRRRGSDDSLLSFEGEYSQKQHYHEAVSLAPTLLVQLKSILYLFENEHLDLPRELVNDLDGHHKDLTKQVQYGTYKWQCPGNILKELQEQQEAKEALEAAEEEGDDGEGGKDNGEKADGEKTAKRKRRKKLEGGGGEGGGGVNGKEMLQSGATTGHGGKAKGKKSHGKLDTAGARKQSSFQRENSSSTGENQTETGQGGGGGMHQPNFLQVVSFSMSSKVCEDKGWILQESEKDKSQEEKEQRNILEVCLERLRESLTLVKIDSSRYRNLGHDKPLYSRYYGDFKREQMLKYISKKSTSGKSPSFMNQNKGLIPRMNLTTPDPGQKQLFHHSLHDTSATSFYPSGNVAVIVSRAGLRMPGAYTLVYNDDEEKSLLASFTPTGHCCSYHPNGFVKFLSTEKKGIVFDTDGAVTKKWEWVLPHLKLPNPVPITLSDHFTLRCNNRNQMTLVFTCHKETVKLQVGQVLSAVEPVTQEELGYLVTEEEWQSKSAEECIRPPPPPPPPKKKDKKKRLSRQLTQPSAAAAAAKPVFQMSDVIKSLEMEDPSMEYNIPAEKELLRLTRKIKNVCDNWLDHYRIAIGIRPPHLNRISSAIPHRRKRGIKSAKPTMDNHARTAQDMGIDQQQRMEDGGAFLLPRSKPIRSPSAPPVSQAQRRPVSTMSTMSRQSRMPTSSPNRLKSATYGRDRGMPRIEFDMDEAHRPATAASFKSGTLPGNQTPGHTPHTAWSTSSPSRTACSTPGPSLKQRRMKPLTGCPIALRAEMLGDTTTTCRCSRHKVPSIGDLELDKFMRECVPRTQLIVIGVVSALFPESMPCHEMYSKFYDRQHRNRTKPCYQSRNDPYRLLLYDVISAVHLSGHKQPLLLQRHNAVPGMFLIYAGGKLVFCDHIFNGYGNAKRDFQKQLLQSRQDSSLGNFLPADFRFSPSRGRRGLRSAWGGEIGGTGVGRNAVSGLPSVFSVHSLQHQHTMSNNIKHTQSPDTRITRSPGSSPRRHIDTAADFLSLSLKNTNNLVALAL